MGAADASAGQDARRVVRGGDQGDGEPRAVQHPAESGRSAAATFDAVRDGLADVSFGSARLHARALSLTQIAELPFIGDSAESTSVAYQRVYEKHLAKVGRDKGLKVLAMFTHGPGGIYNTKRPITRLPELQGLKFRVGGGMVNEIGKALGINVTVQAGSRVATSCCPPG